SLRTNRTFLVCVTYLNSFLVGLTADGNSSCATTDTASYQNLGSAEHLLNSNDFNRLVEEVQLTRDQVGGRTYCQGGSRVGDVGSQTEAREDHGLGKETMLNLQSSCAVSHTGQRKQRRGTIRHQASDHASERFLRLILCKVA